MKPNLNLESVQRKNYQSDSEVFLTLQNKDEFVSSKMCNTSFKGRPA